MSYQGGQLPSDLYWAGHAPTDAYGRQDVRNLPPLQSQAPQYQPHQTAPNTNEQHWNQNRPVQYGYPMNPAYPTNSYEAPIPSPQPQPQPQAQPQAALPPQFISPAQLFQQPLTQSQSSQGYEYQQRTTQPSARQAISSSRFQESATAAPAPTHDSDATQAMLLVSLAEEYFQAAHMIAPAAAFSMSLEDVSSYEKLVATGLGCLDAILKQVKVAPRMEANIRLRYAGVLFEETENSMEAEMCLSKGISLCERNHYYDLKYAMQFLLAKFMAKKNPKAAMKALDGHINEADAYQHFSWVYVFRLLRASLGIESGLPADAHVAIQNLKAVAQLATNQGDYPIHLVASLLEAIAYLRTAGPSAMEHVRAAIAAARMNQSHPSCMISQLTAITLILDVVSSYEEGNSDVMLQKLKNMQTMMDSVFRDTNWGMGVESIAIPIRRTPKSSQTVSGDTRMILGIGEDGGDKLMMTFLSKKEAFGLSYLLSGVCLLHKNSGDGKGLKYLQAGLDAIEVTQEARASRSSPGLLPHLLEKTRWRGELICYFRVIIAFCHANLGMWPEMQECLKCLETTAKKYEIPLIGSLGIYLKYLTGVYQQGTGNLDSALRIYQDGCFKLPVVKGTHISADAQFERDLGILAMLNALSIYQEPQRLDPRRNAAMLEELRNLCVNHGNKDIEIAFNVMAAAIETSPPTPLHDTKNHLRFTISSAGKTKNTQFLCITLSVMFKRFFSNVVGDQAEKSARSASVQAAKNGNPLWRSVADGMLAKCLEVQGKQQEANSVLGDARRFAQKAFHH